MLLKFVTSLFVLIPSAALANPFGVPGIVEPGFLPNETMLGSILRTMLKWQTQFQLEITAQLNLVSDDNLAQFLLIFACFAYGVIHSIGPGHGKVVLASWIMASQNSKLKQALYFSTISAFTQSFMAISAVGVIFLILNATQKLMGQLITLLDIITGLVLITLAIRLLWRYLPYNHSKTCGCVHHEVPNKLLLQRSLILTAIAAGLRPCTGAILVLTLAFSKDIYVWGVISVLAMGSGVALGLIFVGIIVAYCKSLAKKWASTSSSAIGVVSIKIIEISAAVFLCVWGFLMLISSLKLYI